LAFAFFIVVVQLLEKKGKIIKSKAFAASYGSIVEGLNLKKMKTVRLYYCLFFIRRVFYVGFLLIPMKYPIFQLTIIPFLLVIPVFYILLE